MTKLPMRSIFPPFLTFLIPKLKDTNAYLEKYLKDLNQKSFVLIVNVETTEVNKTLLKMERNAFNGNISKYLILPRI